MQFLKKLWKMWENRDIKLVRTEKRRNYLVSEPSYHTKKSQTKLSHTKKVLGIEMKKTQILMNKPVSLG